MLAEEIDAERRPPQLRFGYDRRILASLEQIELSNGYSNESTSSSNEIERQSEHKKQIHSKNNRRREKKYQIIKSIEEKLFLS